MTSDRRGFLKAAGAGCIMAAAPRMSWPAVAQSRDPADHTLRIANGLVELGPQQIVSTTLYNAQFPGPLLHVKEGKPVTVDVHNDTDTPELVHWHGLMVPSEVDGTAKKVALSPASRHATDHVRAEAVGLPLLPFPHHATPRSHARGLLRPGRPALCRTGQ